jgi:hypothetical protein
VKPAGDSNLTVPTMANGMGHMDHGEGH